MGNTSSSAAPQNLQSALKEWTFVRDTVDPLYGAIKVYARALETICLLSSSHQDPPRNTFDHPHIIKLHYAHTEKPKEFCSSVHNVTLIYEYVTNNLQKCIQERRKQIAFTDSQIWALLY